MIGKRMLVDTVELHAWSRDPRRYEEERREAVAAGRVVHFLLPMPSARSGYKGCAVGIREIERQLEIGGRPPNTVRALTIEGTNCVECLRVHDRLVDRLAGE